MKGRESFLSNVDEKLKDIDIPEEKKGNNVINILKIIFFIFSFFIFFCNAPKKLLDKKIMDITNNYKIGINITDINDKSNIINNKPYKLNKTIAVVFAGRKRYLNLLIKYLMNLNI